MNRDRWLPILVLVGLVAALLGVRFSTHASLKRNWAPEYAFLPSVEIVNDIVAIRNVRDTDPRGTGDPAPVHTDRSYRLDDLRRAWFVLEKRSGPGSAHAMISFEFAGPDFLVISPEPRLERGESFTLVGGLLRRYELMYLIATETDRLRWSAQRLNRKIYVYPLAADEARVRQLFVDMATRAGRLGEEPEFYHAVFNSVSGNILDHLKPMSKRRLPSLVFLPSRLDRILYAAGLFRSQDAFTVLRTRAQIADAAKAWQPGMDFSRLIRRRWVENFDGL